MKVEKELKPQPRAHHVRKPEAPPAVSPVLKTIFSATTNVSHKVAKPPPPPPPPKRHESRERMQQQQQQQASAVQRSASGSVLNVGAFESMRRSPSRSRQSSHVDDGCVSDSEAALNRAADRFASLRRSRLMLAMANPQQSHQSHATVSDTEDEPAAMHSRYGSSSDFFKEQVRHEWELYNAVIDHQVAATVCGDDAGRCVCGHGHTAPHASA